MSAAHALAHIHIENRRVRIQDRIVEVIQRTCTCIRLYVLLIAHAFMSDAHAAPAYAVSVIGRLVG